MAAWPASLMMLGCGNMGGAMLGRWLAAGLPPERVTVVNRSGVPPQPGIRTLTEMPAETPAILVIAVKPHQMDVAAAAIVYSAAQQSLPRDHPNACSCINTMSSAGP